MMAILLWMCAGCFVAAIATGIIIASWYQPSAEALRDAGGNVLHVYRADADVRDADGDIVTLKGKYFVSTENIQGIDSVTHTASLKHGAMDAGKHTGSIPKSWYSVHVDLSQDTEYGSLVRSVHAGSMDVAVTLLVIVCGCVLLRPRVAGGNNPRLQLILALACTGVIMLSAWCGSVLPWDVRAQHAFSIGTHVLDTYVPVVGPAISTYVWGGEYFRLPDLMRVFVLHVLIAVPFLLALHRFLVRKLPAPAFHAGWFSMGVITAMVAGLIRHWKAVPGLSAAQMYVASVDEATVGPEWYLRLPYVLSRVVSEDLCYGLLAMAVILIAAYGVSARSNLIQRIGYGAAIVSYLSLVIGTLLSVVL